MLPVLSKIPEWGPSACQWKIRRGEKTSLTTTRLVLVTSGRLSLFRLDTPRRLPKQQDGASEASASGIHRRHTQEPHEKPRSHPPRVDPDFPFPPALATPTLSFLKRLLLDVGTSTDTLSPEATFAGDKCHLPLLALAPPPLRTSSSSPPGPPAPSPRGPLACTVLLSAAVLLPSAFPV